MTLVSASWPCQFAAYGAVSAQATIEFDAGAPLQLGLTTLASDSWVPTYPG